MDGRLVLAALMLTACKAELGGGTINNEQVDGGDKPDSSQVQIDAAIDGAPGLGPWSTPAAVPGANSALAEDDPTMSSNLLELYFKRNDAGDNNLYWMKRANVTAAWGTPAALTNLNTTPATEESPRLTPDDLTLYFARAGDIYKSTRVNIGDPWPAATAVPTLNTANVLEKWAAVCTGGYVILSRAVTGNAQDLFAGTVAGGANTALANLNTTANEQGTFLSADCMTLYFQSDRDGEFNLYMSTRTTPTGPWSNPTKLPDFNTATFAEEDPWISTDQRTFVYANNSSGNKDVYISTR